MVRIDDTPRVIALELGLCKYTKFSTLIQMLRWGTELTVSVPLGIPSNTTVQLPPPTSIHDIFHLFIILTWHIKGSSDSVYQYMLISNIYGCLWKYIFYMQIDTKSPEVRDAIQNT